MTRMEVGDVLRTATGVGAGSTANPHIAYLIDTQIKNAILWHVQGQCMRMFFIEKSQPVWIGYKDYLLRVRLTASEGAEVQAGAPGPGAARRAGLDLEHVVRVEVQIRDVHGRVLPRDVHGRVLPRDVHGRALRVQALLVGPICKFVVPDL